MRSQDTNKFTSSSPPLVDSRSQLSSVLRVQQYSKLDRVFCLLDKISRVSATLRLSCTVLSTVFYNYHNHSHSYVCIATAVLEITVGHRTLSDQK